MGMTFIKQDTQLIPRLAQGIIRKNEVKIKDGLLWALATRSANLSDKSEIISEVVNAPDWDTATKILKSQGVTTPENPSIIGMEWLGYGYEPFGQLPDERSTKNLLFDIPLDFNTCTFNDKTYSKYSSVEYTYEGNGGLSKIDVKSIQDISNEITSKITAGLNIGLFGGELSTALSYQVSKHWEYLFSRIQLFYNSYRLRFTDVNFLKQILKPSIKVEMSKALTSKRAFHDFLDNYGCYYINGIMVGAYASIYSAFSKEDFKSKKEMQVTLDAHYKVLSGGTSTEIKNEYSRTSSKETTSVISRGGKSIPTKPEDLERSSWQSEAIQSPTWIGFTGGGTPETKGLVPMYYLFDNDAQPRLIEWWKEYIQNNSHFADIGERLGAINVNGDSNSAEKGKNNTKANIYTLVPDNTNPIDVNKGAGGWYVYIGQKKIRLNDDYSSAITDLVTIRGKNAIAPVGYKKIDFDLNRGAGGDFIYLCVEYGNTEQIPIRNLSLLLSSDKWGDPYYNGWEVVKDASGGNSDLNKGAGGKFIYLLIDRR